MKTRKFDRTGYLAIAPQAMFEDFVEEAAAANADAGDVAVVCIQGPLTRAASWWCDSHEAIAARIKTAAASAASTVVLRIDSPGGEAAGLFEAVAEARDILKASKKRTIAFTDGRAASAAYAWACAADEVVLSPSGQVGSVGVISARWDESKAMERAGVRVTLTVSGKRKAFGHASQPMSTDERELEQQSVDDLAAHFFSVVGAARNMSPDAVSDLEAGMFLGSRAVEAGLADRVETWGALLASLQTRETMTDLAKSLAALQAAAKGKGAKASAARAKLAAFAALAASEDKDEDKDEAAEDEDKDEAAEDESDEDKAEDESDEDKAEDEEPKEEASVAASSASAVARGAEDMAARLAKLEAKLATSERKALLESRPDISAELRGTLASLPVNDARKILAGIPKPKRVAPAASATVAGTAPAGDVPRGQDAAAKALLDAQMGITSVASTGIEKSPYKLTLGAPVVTKVGA